MPTKKAVTDTPLVSNITLRLDIEVLELLKMLASNKPELKGLAAPGAMVSLEDAYSDGALIHIEVTLGE